jgi:hypothetical protein
MDYTIFYKNSYDNGDLSNSPQYDIYFSAFDNCNRTKNIFQDAKALEKKWFIFPQYNGIDELPDNNKYKNDFFSEYEYFYDFINFFVQYDYK